MHQYDVIVVGCGIAGACVARELSRYCVDVAVLEAGLDVAEGATRANSGIVHAGFDPEPGSSMAYYNVYGSEIYPQWARELGFPYQRNGSLVLALNDDQIDAIHTLYDRGQKNGVKDLRILSAAEVLELEPSVSPEVKGALLAPTGAICDPYQVALRAAENAAQHGVSFYFDTHVDTIERIDSSDAQTPYLYSVSCSNGQTFTSRIVINAAGVHADKLHAQVSQEALHITACRGEYCLLDVEDPGHISHTLFQAPSEKGKGVLVTPTVHGNLLVGPNAQDQADKDCVSTTRKGLADIVDKARATYPGLSTRRVITNFAGLRARGDVHDFVIGEPCDAPGFYNIAAFASPGLTSAPAVAHEMARTIADVLGVDMKADFDPCPHLPALFHHLNEEQLVQAVAADPSMGHIVCRCRKVSEADIVHALHTRIPVLCLDALKWRTDAMMGACHGGFCEPEIAKIIARELGIRPDELPKRFTGATIVEGAHEDYSELVASEKHIVPTQAAPTYDVLVVGGGAGGIAAANCAARNGASVVLVDREESQGGILKQCIHNGFGLHRFACELTGPEYASRELADLAQLPITVISSASVLDMVHTSDGYQCATVVSPAGVQHIRAASIVLATGSRERGAGALNMAGSRPAGVFSAGSAQNFMNLQGCMPGKRVVIMGSGDIGLIMARRLHFAGADVIAVFARSKTPSGLRRNIVQCLDDFDIPLRTGHTVIELEGTSRLTAVIVAEVDQKTRQIIPGTEERIECDTLLLSVGLIPENGVAVHAGVEMDPVTGGPRVNERFETSIPGVFACGNSLHIHDLVDFVSMEGEGAGKSAAQYAYMLTTSHKEANGPNEDAYVHEKHRIDVIADEGVKYVVPQHIEYASSDDEASITMRLRTTKAYEGARLVVEAIDADGVATQIARRKIAIAVPAEMQSIPVKLNTCAHAHELRVRMVM